MTGFLIMLALWLGLGELGAVLAYRGSLRDYGKNLYGRGMFFWAPVLGPSAFFGSMVAW